MSEEKKKSKYGFVYGLVFGIILYKVINDLILPNI